MKKGWGGGAPGRVGGRVSTVGGGRGLGQRSVGVGGGVSRQLLNAQQCGGGNSILKMRRCNYSEYCLVSKSSSNSKL